MALAPDVEQLSRKYPICKQQNSSIDGTTKVVFSHKTKYRKPDRSVKLAFVLLNSSTGRFVKLALNH